MDGAQTQPERDGLIDLSTGHPCSLQARVVGTLTMMQKRWGGAGEARQVGAPSGLVDSGAPVLTTQGCSGVRSRPPTTWECYASSSKAHEHRGLRRPVCGVERVAVDVEVAD